jgi:hypothetical protein
MLWRAVSTRKSDTTLPALSCRLHVACGRESEDLIPAHCRRRPAHQRRVIRAASSSDSEAADQRAVIVQIVGGTGNGQPSRQRRQPQARSRKS